MIEIIIDGVVHEFHGDALTSPTIADALYAPLNSVAESRDILVRVNFPR